MMRWIVTIDGLTLQSIETLSPVFFDTKEEALDYIYTLRAITSEYDGRKMEVQPYALS